MRTILFFLLSMAMLSGCVLAELGAVEATEGMAAVEGGAGAEAVAGVAGAGAGFSATEIFVSSDLLDVAAQRGVVGDALYRLTAEGTRTARIALDSQELFHAEGRVIGRIETGSGRIFAPNGSVAGYLNPNDATIYDYTGQSGQAFPIATMRGWVERAGVNMFTQDGSIVLRTLRPHALFDVTAIGRQYEIRLADGTTGLIPAGAAVLTLYPFAAATQSCPDDDGGGAVIRHSGEVISFNSCQQRDGALVLATPHGAYVVDAADVANVLTGGESAQRHLAEAGDTYAKRRRTGFAEMSAATLQTQSYDNMRQNVAAYGDAYTAYYKEHDYSDPPPDLQSIAVNMAQSIGDRHGAWRAQLIDTWRQHPDNRFTLAEAAYRPQWSGHAANRDNSSGGTSTVEWQRVQPEQESQSQVPMQTTASESRSPRSSGASEAAKPSVPSNGSNNSRPGSPVEPPHGQRPGYSPPPGYIPRPGFTPWNAPAPILNQRNYGGYPRMPPPQRQIQPVQRGNSTFSAAPRR
jgi:hypothetical protein